MISVTTNCERVREGCVEWEEVEPCWAGPRWLEGGANEPRNCARELAGPGRGASKRRAQSGRDLNVRGREYF